MRFHLPSFLLGAVVGASGAALAPRLRPVAVELATGCYKLLDAALVKLARGREDVSDLLAEARARARTLAPARAAAGGAS
ncbi:MAG TPA: hypothetical protein VMJ10_11965 [Kofleriaceae bacterium]|nr:hypothetical protein [Kofleriaceae bacterium]